MRSSHKLILGQSKLFKGLDQETLEKIAEHTEIKAFNKGEHLFYQDDVANAFYCVIDGWISVYRVAAEGEQVIMHVFKDGESFAGPAALSFGYYPASAMAESNCTVLEINVSSIKSVFEDSPDMSLNIINNISQRYLAWWARWSNYKPGMRHFAWLNLFLSCVQRTVTWRLLPYHSVSIALPRD